MIQDLDDTEVTILKALCEEFKRHPHNELSIEQLLIKCPGTTRPQLASILDKLWKLKYIFLKANYNSNITSQNFIDFERYMGEWSAIEKRFFSLMEKIDEFRIKAGSDSFSLGSTQLLKEVPYEPHETFYLAHILIGLRYIEVVSGNDPYWIIRRISREGEEYLRYIKAKKKSASVDHSKDQIPAPNNTIHLNLKNNILRILHLSDIQEGMFGVKNERPQRYQDLLADLGLQFEHIHKKNPIDIIIITGDLTSKGDVKEFEILSNEFIPMLFKIFINSSNPIPPERYLVVPGNHDLEWEKGTARFNNFIEFCERHGFSGHFIKDEPELIYVNMICMQGNISPRFALLGLNSCLEIYDKTTSKMANIPKSYYAKTVDSWDDTFKALPKIMVCHHPLHKISMADENSLIKLNKCNVRLTLAGDIHKALPSIDVIEGIKCISAGALFASKAERGDAPRQFSVYTIDLETLKFDSTIYQKIQDDWEEKIGNSTFLNDTSPTVETDSNYEFQSEAIDDIYNIRSNKNQPGNIDVGTKLCLELEPKLPLNLNMDKVKKDISKLTRLKPIYHQNTRSRINSNGMLIYQENKNKTYTSYLQLFRNGRIFTVSGDLPSCGKDSISMGTIELEMTKACLNYIYLLKDLGAELPIKIIPALWVDDPIYEGEKAIQFEWEGQQIRTEPLDTDPIIGDLILWENYTVNPEILIGFFRKIWQAGGRENSLTFNRIKDRLSKEINGIESSARW